MNIELRTRHVVDEELDYDVYIDEVYINGKLIGAYEGAIGLVNLLMEHLNKKAVVYYGD